jgi:hypothetical protein
MPDALRDALRDLNDAGYAHITPPGVDAVRRAVRRRRGVRAGLAGFTVVAAVAALALPGVLGSTAPPVQSSPSVVDTFTESWLPTDSASPTAASAPVGAGTTSTACTEHWAPELTGYQFPLDNGTSVTFRLMTGPGTSYCSNARIRLGWVVYAYHTDGKQHLYATDSVYVRPGGSAKSTLRMASQCQGNYYFFAGDMKIPSTIPAGGHSLPLPSLDAAKGVAGVWEGYYTSLDRPSCAYPTTPPPTTDTASPGPS